jgi:hypothetical protein
MSIRQQAPPANTGFPKASFEKDRYEDLIFTQGYDVIVYDAVECPCKSQGTQRADAELCWYALFFD